MLDTTAIKTEDEVLNFTQLKREAVVDHLSKDKIPDDPKMLGALLAALDGMDRAALTKKKIQADSQIGDKLGLAGAAITQLFTTMREKTKNRQTTNADAPVNTAPTTIPSSIEKPVIKEGELGTVHENLSYDDIITDDA